MFQSSYNTMLTRIYATPTARQRLTSPTLPQNRSSLVSGRKLRSDSGGVLIADGLNESLSSRLCSHFAVISLDIFSFIEALLGEEEEETLFDPKCTIHHISDSKLDLYSSFSASSSLGFLL